MSPYNGRPTLRSFGRVCTICGKSITEGRTRLYCDEQCARLGAQKREQTLRPPRHRRKYEHAP